MMRQKRNMDRSASPRFPSTPSWPSSPSPPSPLDIVCPHYYIPPCHAPPTAFSSFHASPPRSAIDDCKNTMGDTDLEHYATLLSRQSTKANLVIGLGGGLPNAVESSDDEDEDEVFAMKRQQTRANLNSLEEMSGRNSEIIKTSRESKIIKPSFARSETAMSSGSGGPVSILRQPTGISPINNKAVSPMSSDHHAEKN